MPSEKADAVRFGTFGTFVGHELAHALTLGGLFFDAGGLVHESWSKPAHDAFDARVLCYERQLNRFGGDKPGKISARALLDEYVAEVVGVTVALAAMETESGVPTGDTARRRDFFVAYAQSRCPRPGDLDAQRDLTHPTARTSIDAGLSNLPEFASAFQCAPGTPMAPYERCELW